MQCFFNLNLEFKIGIPMISKILTLIIAILQNDYKYIDNKNFLVQFLV